MKSIFCILLLSALPAFAVEADLKIGESITLKPHQETTVVCGVPERHLRHQAKRGQLGANLAVHLSFVLEMIPYGVLNVDRVGSVFGNGICI